MRIRLVKQEQRLRLFRESQETDHREQLLLALAKLAKCERTVTTTNSDSNAKLLNQTRTCRCFQVP